MAYESKREILCIQNLFRAVLELAARDAYGLKAQSKKKEKIRKDALDFFQNEDDLKTICSLANVEYKAILGVLALKNIKNKEKYNKILACF